MACAVVITGASSGIGRAAALAFARRGSRLALAARARSPLEQIARECDLLGAEVLWLPTDVRDEGQVAELARRTAERFGRLDVWVNSAGVIAYGCFEDVPAHVFRAVVETNLFGHVHTPAQVEPSSSRTPSPLPCTAASSRQLSRLGTMPTDTSRQPPEQSSRRRTVSTPATAAGSAIGGGNSPARLRPPSAASCAERGAAGFPANEVRYGKTAPSWAFGLLARVP
jgi:NAD(P)-dependent dehydrogenase (short-subunit alcohol dehydrogenase family)